MRMITTERAMALAEQWLALDSQEARSGMSDDEASAIADQREEIGLKLMAEPVQSVAGLRAKLRVMARWAGIATPAVPGEREDFVEDMLASVLADAERLM